MTERPILFSGPMVRAILDGRKTQTRRLVVPGRSRPWMTPEFMAAVRRWESCGSDSGDWAGWWKMAVGEPGPRIGGLDRGHVGSLPCPYGVPGDRLWVRETWAPHADEEEAARNWTTNQPFTSCGYLKPTVFYRCDGGDPFINNWRPSIHMPRWASRLLLEVVAVRVERLQAITEEDARAEGFTIPIPDNAGGWHWDVLNEGRPCAAEFATNWDFINAKRAPWQSNPWVWVVEFKPVEVPR